MPASLDPPLGPGDHVDGPDHAPLELVMYGDFQCPYCAAAQSIVRRVRDRLDGRLRVAFRHMPLPSHPDADNAAQAAEAAAAQGAFWPMHDELYAGRGRLSLDDLVRHAVAIGIDGARVRQEVSDGVHVERVARDERSARAAGIAGTPAFFVNGVLHEGAFDAGSLVEALETPAAGRAQGPSRNKCAVWAPDPWMPDAALERSNTSGIASIEGGVWRRGRASKPCSCFSTDPQ